VCLLSDIMKISFEKASRVIMWKAAMDEKIKAAEKNEKLGSYSSCLKGTRLLESSRCIKKKNNP
jgi:hypothetical protein